MRIFLTGATGFIGSHVIPELLARGHQVLGVTRSEAGAAALRETGVEAWQGTLEAPDGLAAGAATCDAVIHCAFDHDFDNFVANCEKDARVIAALGGALKGSDRPLLITSGVGIGDPEDGTPAREDVFNEAHPNPRIATEYAGRALLEEGVAVAMMRMAQIHDPQHQGLVSPYVAHAREQGVAAYVGDGEQRWPAAHVGDVARLYALAVERDAPGARYHAVAEEGVAMRTIAETVAAGLGVPVRSIAAAEAKAHFGPFLSRFVGLDMPATSAWTRATLGWTPTGPGLIEDLAAMDYGA